MKYTSSSTTSPEAFAINSCEKSAGSMLCSAHLSVIKTWNTSIDNMKKHGHKEKANLEGYTPYPETPSATARTPPL